MSHRNSAIYLIAIAVLLLVGVPGVALPSTTANRTLKAQAPSDRFDAASLNAALEKAEDGPCKGLYRIMVQEITICTHGFDEMPQEEHSHASPAAPSADAAARASTVQCDGDGASGNRVEVIYAHPPGTDRYDQYLASFRQWMAEVDNMIYASAQATGGVRRVRFVHDPSCNLIVRKEQVSAAAMEQDDPGAMWEELAAKGYNRRDRVYVVFADTSAYGLGVGSWYNDDRLRVDNRYNHGPSYTSTPFPLWRFGARNPAHELLHALGAVNDSAPNGYRGHCTDEYDRMCEQAATQVICSDSAHELRFDCNHNDYFHTNPPAGSYLATHWNAANNSFLIGAAPVPRAEKRWTGAVSTEWWDDDNWSPAGVPGPNENCLIPAGRPRYPELGSISVECYGVLTVEAGAQLTVGYQAGLTAERATIRGTVTVHNSSFFDLRSSPLIVDSGGLLVLHNGDYGMDFYGGGTLVVNGRLRVLGTFPLRGTFESSDTRANLLINPTGVVEVAASGELSVDGTVRNYGVLKQTRAANASQLTSYGIPLEPTSAGYAYYGIDITPTGDLGPTTVTIHGNRACEEANQLLGLTVARCIRIEPTTAHNATAKFYYQEHEQRGQLAPQTYHFNGTSWEPLSSTRGGSGDNLWVQTAKVSSYSFFALKDPSIPTYRQRIPSVQ